MLQLQTRATQTSPLHIASRNNATEIAKELLKNGAKLDLKDSDGKVQNSICCVYNYVHKLFYLTLLLHGSTGLSFLELNLKDT